MDKQPNLFEIGFSKTFELAFAAAIHLDELHGQSLQELDGKVVELWVAPVKFPLFCLINDGKIATQTHLAGEADVTLKTGLRQFRVLAQEGFFEARYIRGDEATGEQFIHALESLEIDWEEHLSHYTGDLIAFKIGHGVRSMLETQHNTKAYLSEAFKEYLQFEINALPTRHQVNHFIKSSQDLSSAVDTIEARLTEVKAKLNASQATSE